MHHYHPQALSKSLRLACRQTNTWITLRRFGATPSSSHENPLGLPRTNKSPPTIPRRTVPGKRPIPNVKKVIAVASGKGGVGKSTIAVNLAFALSMHPSRPLVSILDLDIFGPSVPKLMGLDYADEPSLTEGGGIIPLVNHGMPSMSMGFLLLRPASDRPGQPQSSENTAVVWRGLMVQKAVQQLLFDVDWKEAAGGPLDILVLDLPPGTGDVPLTLGQLVQVDGAVITTTPQAVSLADVRKGVAMFRKLSMNIIGIVLNTAYFVCPDCDKRHYIFGSRESFNHASTELGMPVLGELPLLTGISSSGDEGVPFMLQAPDNSSNAAEAQWRNTMTSIASHVFTVLQ